jgi:large conductance mechanosensitive channel
MIMFKEFRDFAMRGNVIDMAIGIIIGSAFGAIVKSLVDDIIMPPVGVILRGINFSDFFIVLKEGSSAKPYASLVLAQEAGAVTLNYGVFLNTIISFLIVAFVVYLMIRSINKIKKQEETPPMELITKECPICFTEIPIKALRCPNCTSDL